MHLKLPLRIIALVALGLALMTTALVMAEESAPASTAQGQEGPGPEGAAVMEYVLNTNPYTAWGSWPADRWSAFGGYLQSGAPHGESVRIFVNDVALEAAAAEDFDGTLPPGSLVVKENFGGMVEEPGDLAAITLMYKVDGYNPDANDWFWVKAQPDGTIDAEGAPEGCVSCHAQEGNADYLLRYAFGEEPAATYVEPLPAADGAAIMDYVINTEPYLDWGTWPTTEDNPEDFSGILPSGEPHGASVRIFVNDRALDALTREGFDGVLPNGSIVIKENFGGPPEEPGDLAALTLMYKVEGFNPEANDWYWAKTQPDGTVDAEGAVEGCIGCHGQEGNSDYLLRYDLPTHEVVSMDEGEAVEVMTGDELVELRCTVCHSRERIDSASKDRVGWEATVDRMIGYGAQLNDAEREALISYLVGE